MVREHGLLTAADIKAVLAEEGDADRYQEMRQGFSSNEPLLYKNMRHWIDSDLASLGRRFMSEPLTGGQLNWIGHLMERYFLRGFRMDRKAFEVDLEKQLAMPSCEPHMEEPKPPEAPPGVDEDELDEGEDLLT
jgi:hypothetical protein